MAYNSTKIRLSKTMKTSLRIHQPFLYRLIMDLLRQWDNTLLRAGILYPKFRRERAPIQTNVSPGGITREENNPLSPLRERLLDNLGLSLEARPLRAADHEPLVARLRSN